MAVEVGPFVSGKIVKDEAITVKGAVASHAQGLLSTLCVHFFQKSMWRSKSKAICVSPRVEMPSNPSNSRPLSL
jgi:hypothetical protein